jgi:hypothetical protein
VSGADIDFIWDSEEIECLGSLIHDIEVTVTAHDDGD